MIIRYHSEFVKLTGSINAAILMSKLEYWFEVKEGKSFYKFLAPCEHEFYREGDSWTEELIMSLSEVRFAFRRIGIAYKSKKAFMESGDRFQGKFYASYYDRMRKRTYYFRNHELVENMLQEHSVWRDLKDSPQMDFRNKTKVKAGKAKDEVSINDETQSRLSNKDYNKNNNKDNNKDSSISNQSARDESQPSDKYENKENNIASNKYKDKDISRASNECRNKVVDITNNNCRNKAMDIVNYEYGSSCINIANDKYKNKHANIANDECKDKNITSAKDEYKRENTDRVNDRWQDKEIGIAKDEHKNKTVKVMDYAPKSKLSNRNNDEFTKKINHMDSLIDDDNKASDKGRMNSNEPLIPVAEICKMYNSSLGELLGERTVLSNYEKKCLEGMGQAFALSDFKRAFEKTAASKFLCGKTARSHWKASLAWLLNKENMEKVLSGKYDEPEKRDSGITEKVKTFLQMDSHAWNFDEIELLEMRLIDQRIAEMNEQGIGKGR